MNALVDMLSAISNLLLTPAYYLLGRQDDHASRESLAEFLDALVRKYATEGVRHAADPMVVMFQDSSLTGRTIEDASSERHKPRPSTSAVERVEPRLGWAFTIEPGGSRGDVERLAQILDSELRDRLLAMG
ncbi:MAG: hypothetical protein WEE66_04555 [Actinomycetota bacterium]